MGPGEVLPIPSSYIKDNHFDLLAVQIRQLKSIKARFEVRFVGLIARAMEIFPFFRVACSQSAFWPILPTYTTIPCPRLDFATLNKPVSALYQARL
jgi:hypothetical protein